MIYDYFIFVCFRKVSTLLLDRKKTEGHDHEKLGSSIKVNGICDGIS